MRITASENEAASKTSIGAPTDLIARGMETLYLMSSVSFIVDENWN